MASRFRHLEGANLIRVGAATGSGIGRISLSCDRSSLFCRSESALPAHWAASGVRQFVVRAFRCGLGFFPTAMEWLGGATRRPVRARGSESAGNSGNADLAEARSGRCAAAARRKRVRRSSSRRDVIDEQWRCHRLALHCRDVPASSPLAVLQPPSSGKATARLAYRGRQAAFVEALPCALRPRHGPAALICYHRSCDSPLPCRNSLWSWSRLRPMSAKLRSFICMSSRGPRCICCKRRSLSMSALQNAKILACGFRDRSDNGRRPIAGPMLAALARASRVMTWRVAGTAGCAGGAKSPSPLHAGPSPTVSGGASQPGAICSRMMAVLLMLNSQH